VLSSSSVASQAQGMSGLTTRTNTLVVVSAQGQSALATGAYARNFSAASAHAQSVLAELSAGATTVYQWNPFTNQFELRRRLSAQAELVIAGRITIRTGNGHIDA
jgi:hypothetical protein